jgi:hypothetical protein
MSFPITNIRNAKSINESNTRFDVEIDHPTYGWIPYTLDPADEDQSIDNDALRALIGSDFAAYVAPTQEELDQEAEEEVRGLRNYLLASHVDPIISNSLRWADMTTEKQNAWTAYRRDLLDITDQDGFPHNVVWPTSPDPLPSLD